MAMEYRNLPENIAGHLVNFAAATGAVSPGDIELFDEAWPGLPAEKQERTMSLLLRIGALAAADPCYGGGSLDGAVAELAGIVRPLLE